MRRMRDPRALYRRSRLYRQALEGSLQDYVTKRRDPWTIPINDISRVPVLGPCIRLPPAGEVDPLVRGRDRLPLAVASFVACRAERAIATFCVRRQAVCPRNHHSWESRRSPCRVPTTSAEIPLQTHHPAPQGTSASQTLTRSRNKLKDLANLSPQQHPV